MRNFSNKIGLLAIFMTGCGVFSPKAKIHQQAPIASNLAVTQKPTVVSSALIAADARGAGTGATAASETVTGEITLKKSLILNRVFLYGFDLQYSSGQNADYALIDQSMALGHVPVTFRILGDKLQVVSDSSRLFESAVNHPEILVNEYRILGQTADTLTVAMDSPGMLLHKTFNGADAAAPQRTWVRSLQYIEDGNYILQESAIMQANGNVQTFMESLFPRDSLVPETYKGIEDNRDKNPSASRFMMITNENVFVERGLTNGVPKREKTAFANRFNLATSTSTIDWYVTPNVPDDFMKEMKSATEGWNRYFHDQLGRDVVQFKGRLPEGVKLGDPRYNVINFDTVAEAGAAYETQAADPMTGIQSHSMIYMPYAWYNIAAGLSDARELPVAATAKLGPKSPEVLFGATRDVIRCARDVSEAATTPVQADLAAAATPEDAVKIVDEFGRRIFISTLFHEMGHAFGLGHNFKASLAYDGEKPVDFGTNPTTYSTMDYNYYQHEVDLVGAIGTTDGPRLEYDRQMISFLYNESRDIKPTDKVIPACNDEDADNIDGGVDPDCIRYDAESNPLVGLRHAMNRLVDASGAKGIETLTLSQAISRQRDQLLGRLADTSLTPDAAAAEKLVTERGTALAKLVSYYTDKGAQSLRVNLSLNAGALRAWNSTPTVDGILMPESDRRAEYVAILTKAAQMTALPDAPKQSIKELNDVLSAFITQNDRFGSTDERTALATKLTKSVQDAVNAGTVKSLGALRVTIAGALSAAKEKAKFASYSTDGKTAEQIAVETLRGIALKGLSATDLGDAKSQAARIAGVKSLATFAALGDDYAAEIQAVRSEIVAVRNSARQAGKQDIVDHTRELIQLLDAPVK